MSSRVVFPHPQLRARMTEDAFQDWVIALAKWAGWKHYHTRRSKQSPSGFPDLVLLRDGRLIFAELKTQTGTVTPEQQKWLDELEYVPLAWAYVWRPADMEFIAGLLNEG